MYIRPLVQTLTFRRTGGTRYILRADLHNRRVTSTVTTRRGATRKIVRTFPTRDDAREYVETVLERRADLGYREVSAS